MARDPDRSKPDGLHWGDYDATGDLPNASGSTIQTQILDYGDVASVAGVLYSCTDPRENGATWVSVGGGVGGYGSIYRDPSSSGYAIATSTSYILVDAFTAADSASSGCTPSAASDKITVTNGGTWRVDFHTQTNGDISEWHEFAVYVNGVKARDICIVQTPTTGELTASGTYNTSGSAVLSVADDQDVDVRVVCGNSETSITIYAASLVLQRLGD